MPLAYIQFLDRSGRPTDPDYGVDEGAHPDQGLPGDSRLPVDPGYGVPGRPPHVGGGPARPGRPIDPGWGVGEGGRPDQGLPGGPNRPERPPHVGGGPARPGRPVDPGFGQGDLHPGHRPPWAGKPKPPKPEWPPGPTDPDWGVDAPIDTPEHPIHIPGQPDNSLPGDPGEHPEHPIPPVAGHPLPPDLPPGSIWPPLPPDAPTGEHMFLVWIQGVGLRYGKFTIPEHETDPDYGVDEGAGAGGEHPDQGLPGGRPPVATQPRPPSSAARPPQPGQPLPRPPIGAGQPTQPIAPGTPPAQPKR